MHESLAIPPDLDRALAMTVLETVRTPAAPTPVAVSGDDHPAAVPPRLDALLEQVVQALVSAGATRDEVLDALQDAFAALLAGRPGDRARETMLALDAHARDTARRLLAVSA